MYAILSLIIKTMVFTIPKNTRIKNKVRNFGVSYLILDAIRFLEFLKFLKI